eukprot:Seg3123.2 transcript_id=Seg3123.2/GoldUCD/mRNA.D3Y31 product="hypothetical protein" protein_id=Seg3123.2/GoldUCD/D3Y31
MKFSSTFIAVVIFGCVASSLAADCDDAIPKKLCRHLTRLENRLEKLVFRSSSLIARAVEKSAEKNAVLFSKTVQLIRNATKTQPMNETEFAKILEDLKNTFEKVEGARVNASVNAFKSIQGASTKVLNLIQKVIKDAMEDDHSDTQKFRERLVKAVKKAHIKIKLATMKAIRKVHQGNAKVEKHVIEALKKLGISEVAQVQTFIQAISKSASLKIALDAEREMQADFDATAEEAYLLIVASDVSGSTYGFKEFWEYVKGYVTRLSAVMLQKLKEAVKRMQPAIYQKIGEIVRIVISEAKRALVEIAGEMVLVTTL